LAEITFETLRLALETTRGTAVTTPTHLLNYEGTLNPKVSRYRPTERRGTRARNYRHVDTRAMAEWEAEGDLDSVLAAVLWNMGVAPLTSPATPTDAVTARLWAHVGSITADNLKTATVYWGDPGLTDQLQSTFAFIDEIEVENDASSEEVATVKIKGMASKATKQTAPTATTVPNGVTYPGQLMQLWIDSGSAIGTTEITDRLVSAKHTIRTGAKAKYIAKGPAHNLSYSLLGREQIVAITTELKLEMLDFDEYDLWAAGTSLKVRVRHNGALIEIQSATDFYHYFEADTYGPMSDMAWEENEGVNRCLRVTIEGQYDATLGSDIRVAVLNNRTTL
jgi:hypothetical protein